MTCTCGRVADGDNDNEAQQVASRTTPRAMRLLYRGSLFFHSFRLLPSTRTRSPRWPTPRPRVTARTPARMCREARRAAPIA